jgi:hypothetical protein
MLEIGSEIVGDTFCQRWGKGLGADTKPLKQNKELRTMMWDRTTETKVHEGTY